MLRVPSGSSSLTIIHALGSTFQTFWSGSNLSSFALKPSVHLPYSTYTHWPSLSQDILGPTSNTWNQRGVMPSDLPIVDLIIKPDSVV